jgi:hypothetical protein
VSSSNLVRMGYKKESVAYGSTPAAVAATGTLNLTADIILTSVKKGSPRNTGTFTLQVLPPAANPTNTVLIAFTGSENAIVCTVTPNDGTNNGAVPVTVTTANLVQLINAGIITGKNPTITDASSLRALQTATGGDTTPLADGGEGDGIVATFSGGSGEFKTARFTSEQYSGTPETTESAQIRTDRLSSGQIVTGLTVEGGHAFELAKEEAIEDFMESAMFNDWVQSSEISGTFEIDLSSGIKLKRSSGNFQSEGVVVGDFIKLSDFVDAGNNVIVMAMAFEDSGQTIVLAGPSGMVDIAPEAAKYQVCDKLSIGVDKKSLTIEKTFTDLTTKALIYRGCLVSQMTLTVEYGSLISGSFDTMGNDYVAADAANEFASYNEYFADPATSNSMNGSVDMPFVATNVTGTWEQDAFCLQNLELQLNNNLTVQNCIGRAAPQDYSPGTAAITASLSSYLKDANWNMLAKKLSQEPFSLGFLVKNLDGYYGFFIPALQVSFEDPASGGQNQEISIEMQGTCKVGSSGESSLTIYRAPT